MFAAILVAKLLFHTPLVLAQSDTDDRDSRIEQGFDIAPVPLNLAGKDRALVGLGSYLVNGVAACNDCHSAGPQTQFAPGGNPSFGQPAKINPETYLGGGQDFGPLVATPGSPHDIRAIYEYLSAVPCIEGPPAPSVLHK